MRQSVASMHFVFFVLFSLFSSGAFAQASGAARVSSTIDAMDVEHHWIAGEHVNWRTGIPDGRPEATEGRHTHCSAFVAAVAEKLGVYILRPPEHGQVLLANAQYDWLASPAARGWTPINSDQQAQARANEGFLVVATYKSHDPHKPGHIAIVRPNSKPRAAIAAEGPQVAQAGSHNSSSTSLRVGFEGHPAAWSQHEVRYYAHAVDR